MSDIVDTSPLGIERTERIAGDDALNSRLDNVTTELQSTQESVTTEVLHRSEGDLVIQRILEGYIQELLEGKSEDFERYIEFQNSQNLNYADVRNFVGGIRTSLAEEIRSLSSTLLDNLQANDTRYNKLVSDVDRYIEILSDITLDSNQITLDNGELRAGAWTILSQARAWDLEIINRLSGLSESVGDSLKDAVEEIQNQLPSTEETITKAIEELSNSPLIKNLSDLLNQSIENDSAYELALAEQARQHANAMAQLAEDIRAEALAKAQAMEDYMVGEVTARITEVNKEVAARKEAIDLLTEDMLTRVDQDKEDFQADMLVVTNRIKSAEDGLTSEIQHRKDGDSSTLNALNTYKVSNDSAITGLSTNLSNNVTKTNANTTLITGLTSRIDTAEDGIESATTAAADAMSKATTAVSANSALAIRVDALAASFTESDGTVVDVNAFNALKAEVNTVKGTVNGLVEDVTALESKYTSVDNKVTTQGTAISTLNTKMSTAENSISQSANDIILLKTDISSINAGLLTKVDSQAFSQLSSDVSELDGKYTTQAGLVTDLRGSLDTTNVNVGNAASAAQNALNTAGSKGKVIFGTSAPAVEDRLSQNLWIDTVGNANTPKRWNGSEWVAVTDKVATDALAAANAATSLANTKADTSAFNSLDQKVTVIDGQVNTNTNSIISLNGKISTVEGTLSTKLDSSAIVNYYTKQQADDKALSTVAGQLSKFEASLALGGGWMDVGREGASSVIETGVGTLEVIDRMSNHFKLTSDSDGAFSGYIGSCNNSSDVPVGTPYVLTGKIRASRADLYDRIYCRFNQYSSESYIYGRNNSTDWVNFTAKGVTNTGNYSALDNIIGAYVPESQIGDWVEFKDCRVSVNSDSLTATNAQAIQNTNAEVSRVDGRVTTTSDQLTSVTGRVSNVENGLALKADVSALNAIYTKTETDAKATSIAAGEISKYDANLVIGGANLFSLKELLSYSGGDLSNTTSYITVTGSTLSMVDQGYNTRLPANLIPIDHTKDLIVSWYPMGSYSGHIIYYVTQDASGAPVIYFLQKDITGDKGADGRVVITIPKSEFSPIVTHLRLGLGSVDNTTYSIRDIQVEQGTKVTAWSPSSRDTQAALAANANAIQTVSAEVARVNGEVVSTANSVSNLSSNVGLLQGSINEVRQTVTNNQESTNTLVTSLKSGMADADDVSMMMRSATVVFEDLNFRDGYNSVDVYNNYYNGALAFNFTDKLPDNPVASTRQIEFIHSGGATTPELGGFNQMVQSRANGVFLIKFVAKLPVGFSFGLTANAYGDGANGYFIGSSEGAGRFKTYYAVYRCGATGSFATVGFVCVNGPHPTPENPLIWYLASSTMYDCLDSKVAPDSVVSGIAEAKNIASTAVNNAEATALIAQNLQASLDNTNANISTNYYTKAEAENAVAGKVEQFSSTIAVGGDNLFTGTKTFNNEASENSISSFQPSYGGFGGSSQVFMPYGLFGTHTVVRTSSNWSGFYLKEADWLGWEAREDLVLSFWANADADVFVYGIASQLGQVALIPANQPMIKYEVLIPKGKPLRNSANQGIVEFYFPNGGTLWYGAVMLQIGTKSSAWQPSSKESDAVVSSLATAITETRSEVSSIDGKVSSQASQILVLESDNATNKNALTVQSRVIDGVKASYMVKMESNGVVGGFGLMQSTGVLGQVVTTFGVNADTFYIGSPSLDKKPFIQRNDWSVINGVWVPPGTYIDTALIANATIGTAHIQDASITNAKIGDLDAAKITAGTLDANRIAANSISADKLTLGDTSNLWPNPYFDNKGVYPISGRAAWNNNVFEAQGNTIQLWGRDHIAPWSSRIPLKAGDTFVIEYVGGRNGGPDRGLNAGLWVYDDYGSGGGAPYQFVGSTVLADLGAGWFRFRHTIQVANNGSGRLAAYGCLYFQIEQAENAADPTYWSVGNVSIRRMNGGELIVNGSITADKLSASAIETVALAAQNVTIYKNPNNPYGERMVQSGGLIQIYDANNKLRVRLGIW